MLSCQPIQFTFKTIFWNGTTTRNFVTSFLASRMAKLIQPAPKYTPQEWKDANHWNYDHADQERKVAEMIRDESARLQHETHVTTIKTQQDVNKKLEQRINDINFWESELARQKSETDDEISAMIRYKNRIEKALAATEIPLHISRECLINREKRMKTDLVHDDVEIQLIKEGEVIAGVQSLLRQVLDQATEQIRLLRSAKYSLDKDLTNKFQALNIDEGCSKLDNNSHNLQFSPASVKIQANSVTPKEWEEFSNKNYLKAEAQRNAATTLRSMIDEILIEVHSDQTSQRETVDYFLKKRIDETEKAKLKLEDHHSKILIEISDMESNIRNLEESIAMKEAPMKLSQTRLENRTSRPDVELCRDRVQYRLVEEVTEITQNIERLKEMLNYSQESLKGLIRTQLTLEEDIDVKQNSLFIDRDQNVVLRQQIDHPLC